MPNIRYCFLGLLFVMLCTSIYARHPLAPEHYAYSENPPLASPEMRRPGFWIAKHPQPDSLIMDNDATMKFNQQIAKKGLLQPMGEHPRTIKRGALQKMVNEAADLVLYKSLYDLNGIQVSQEYWQDTQENLNLSQIPPVTQIRFGFPIRFANQRLIPSADVLTLKAMDLEFDEVQNSGYDIGTPMVFYLDSRDGEWIFGAANTSMGWIKKSDIAIVEYYDWLKYQQQKNWVVSISAHSDVYRDSTLVDFLGYIRMGTKLPLLNRTETAYQVLLPGYQNNTAWIAVSDANEGFLPYTARNIFQQAFKMLNVPYGWGDMNGNYDCSGMLKQLFATFGIFLPRNGKSQDAAAIRIATFAESDSLKYREGRIIAEAIPAITLLRMPGHIMLYLGTVENTPYAIHSVWGVRSPRAEKEDAISAINKTVVSPLNLGLGSQKGSFLMRLSGFSKIGY